MARRSKGRVNWRHIAILSALDIAAAVIALAIFGSAGYPAAYLVILFVFVTWFVLRVWLASALPERPDSAGTPASSARDRE
jgi:fatty acid desaturase